jgi:uncharacterized protein (TIGR02145 family)
MKNTYFIFIAFIFALVACKKETEKPAVEAVKLTYIDSFSVQLDGKVIADGGAEVTHTGFIVANSASEINRIKENGLYQYSGFKYSSLKQNSREFTSMATDLNFNQNYFYAAFAANKNGMAISEIFTFTIDGRSYPIVNTRAASNIEKTEATLNADIEVDGNENISERGFFWSEIANPNNSSAKLVYSGTNNTFGANLTGLVENNTYYFRAYCINNGILKLGQILSFKTNTDMPANMVDIDGNIYPVVKIGGQVWAAENLRTTKFADGSPIPNVISDATWGSLTTAAMCPTNGNSSNNQTYGALYNFYAATSNKGLCPAGWKVPTDEDWKVLETSIGMTPSDLDAFSSSRGQVQQLGGKLKHVGTTYWNSPNSGATDEYGFSVRGGGYRSSDGLYFSFRSNGSMWTSTELSSTTATNRGFANTFVSVTRGPMHKRTGMYIRCLKE